MKTANLRNLSVLMFVALSACEGAITVSQDGTPQPTGVSYEAPGDASEQSRTPQTPGERGAPDPGERLLDPGPPPTSIPSARDPRRLSVDQLRRSIPRVFGRQWESANGQSRFDEYADTLGEADFLRANVHVVEPTSVFAKSMDDMASNVCRRTLREEPERLIPHGADAVEQNLRHLRLLLHGVHIPDDCGDANADLAQLYDDVSQDCAAAASGCESGIDNGWYAVCVAMLTDPQFMIY